MHRARRPAARPPSWLARRAFEDGGPPRCHAAADYLNLPPGRCGSDPDEPREPAAGRAAHRIREIRPDSSHFDLTAAPGKLSTPVALFRGEARGDGRRSRG